MKNVKFSFVVFLLFFSSIFVSAQNVPDPVKYTRGLTYTITKTDGTLIVGTVLNQDDKEVMLSTKMNGMITIQKSQVKDADVVVTTVLNKNITPQVYKKGYAPGTFIYGSIGGGFGSHSMFCFSSNLLTRHNAILSAGYYLNFRSAPGVSKGADLEQRMSMFGLMGGKVLYAKNSLFRTLLKGGISIGSIQTPVDIAPGTINGGWFGTYPEYSFNIRKEVVMGVLLNPSIEIPFSPGFGVSCGLYANINYVSSVYGFETSIIIGRLRNLTGREQRILTGIRLNKNYIK